MMKAFAQFYEFTNWNAIFQTFDAFKGKNALVYAIYSIVDVRLIEMRKTDPADNRLKVFENCAIEYVSRPGPIDAMVNMCVMRLIHRFNKRLRNVDEVWTIHFFFHISSCGIHHFH